MDASHRAVTQEVKGRGSSQCKKLPINKLRFSSYDESQIRTLHVHLVLRIPLVSQGHRWMSCCDPATQRKKQKEEEEAAAARAAIEAQEAELAAIAAAEAAEAARKAELAEV